MFFVVIATLSLRFNLAEIPNFDVMGVVVFSTGAGAGSAPNSFKQSKRTKIFVYVYSENLSIFKDRVSTKTETLYVCYKKNVFKLPRIDFMAFSAIFFLYH